MGKRKSLSTIPNEPPSATIPSPFSPFDDEPLPKRRASQRKAPQPETISLSTDPNRNANVLDGSQALRASPDSDEPDEYMEVEPAGVSASRQTKKEDETFSLLKRTDSDSSLSDISDVSLPNYSSRPKSKFSESEDVDINKAEAKEGKQPASQAAKGKKGAIKEMQFLDPEAEGEEGEADEEELQAALSRPPPVNSDYLPLPWKGRLGYACLCTYLRFSNPPVFSSRTCRIASILENRHPLRNPNEEPHATKNRPDRDQPASIERGQMFVESLGLANARDISKMLRWNDRYGIKFLRLSSEMFPFASHEEYGYKLAPFASEALAEAGRIAAELGHRLTTHPGQFTQLGSPRKQVIANAIRDLEYHAELLTLLKLPPQQDRDAVMILHLGGVFGDKPATLDRFRENYKQLPQGIKDRLVLENDDVSWSVHDLLPLCEELNIPMVLDFHHHNIIFDSDKIREGTKDIVEMFPRILATWERKGITPKMHYSEPTPSAITGRQRRKHSPRVATLPPCPPTMDLMIEAKDKEQAVFELMRTFKLPGFDTFNDMIPHVRKDDNKPIRTPKKKASRKKTKKATAEDAEPEPLEDVLVADEDPLQPTILDPDVGMGGPEGRVYWPPGMEHWLRPMKKDIKPKLPPDALGKDSATKRKAGKSATKAATQPADDPQPTGIIDTTPTPAIKRKAVKPAIEQLADEPQPNGTAPISAAAKRKAAQSAAKAAARLEQEVHMPSTPAKTKAAATKKKKTKRAVTPSDEEDEEAEAEEVEPDQGKMEPVRKSGRVGRRGAV